MYLIVRVIYCVIALTVNAYVLFYYAFTNVSFVLFRVNIVCNKFSC